MRKYSLVCAYALWLPLGLLGGHWFYLRRPGLGVLYMCTAGLLGIGWVADMINMPDHVRLQNQKANLTS